MVYIDPPFNTSADYERTNEELIDETCEFTDTWEWNGDTEVYLRHIEAIDGRICDFITQFRADTESGAYLSFMAIRLLEIYRVLKDTGVLWLHCSVHEQHTLRILLDLIFGSDRMINQVIWNKKHKLTPLLRCATPLNN